MADSLFVGIDVSSLWLDVCCGEEGKVVRFSNDDSGITQVVRMLVPFSPQLIAIESTGGLERALMMALVSAELPVARVDPKRVRLFAYGIGQLAKTDAIDARVLMKFAKLAAPRLLEKKAANHQELAELLVCRSQLIDTRTAHQNQLARTTSSFARKSLQSVLSHLRGRIEKLDRQIEKIIDHDDDMRDLHQLLRSFKGVGPVLAATLISQLPELGKLPHAKIAALAGVAPYPRDSGNTSGPRFIRGGRARVRKALYMCTVAGIRHNAVLKRMYVRLRAAGKRPKVALIACVRKWLRILNAMVRDQQNWIPPLAKA